MFSDKIGNALMFLWLIVTTYLINGSLLFALLASVAVLVGRLIGKATQAGGGKITAEKRFKHAKFFPAFILLIGILLWTFIELELWKMLLVSFMLLLLMVFELTDSYLWLKKERESS